MKNFTLSILTLLSIVAFACQPKKIEEKPSIAFTFDDGSIQPLGGYAGPEWNQMILDHLAEHELEAVFFACGKTLSGEKGAAVLQAWNDAGHRIGNHTFSHPSLGSEITLEEYEKDLMINDSIMRSYTNFYPYFRFPYLNRGNTIEKRDGIRQFLKEKKYNHGYVTSDGYDWYINSRMLQALDADSSINLDAFRELYVSHTFQTAEFFDSLGEAMTGRKIKHVQLLHHNLTSALFLGDLINKFKNEGWNVIDASEAYQDEIYQSYPNEMPAGGDLLGSLGRQDSLFHPSFVYQRVGDKYLATLIDSLKL